MQAVRLLCHNFSAMRTNNFLARFAVAVCFLWGNWLLAQASPSAAPQDHDAANLVKQGQKLNSEGKQAEAITLYQQALQISPNLYEAHLAMGIALDLQGNYDEARSHLNKAIELASPDNQQQALRTLAVSYAFEGKSREAEKYEKQVFDARASRQDFAGAAEIANEMGRIALESGDLDAAYEWYQIGYQTALRKPSLEETYKGLWEFRWAHAQARIAARRGQADEAQKQVAAAKAALDKAKNPEQQRFFPYLTGYVAFYLSDYKTAIAELQQADQHDPFILVLLGEAYEKSGDQAKALESYRKVLTFNNHNPGNAFARPLARQKSAGAT
jgi:tetratricopeptide (TPR) repeat protein